MKINVCFASDSNYIKYLAVSITSILKNADIEDELCFYILENNISDVDKYKLSELKKIKNCEIVFIPVSEQVFQSFSDYNLKYINKTAYYRYLVADVLKDIDKIIYLDVDTIVLSSLRPLFMENIDNHYLAGIEDICYYFYNKHHDTNYKNFINSGVLLINLNLWRKNNISSKLFDITQKEGDKFPFGDQEAINIVCSKKIKFIELSWNVQQTFFEINNLLYHPLKKQIIKSLKNIKIVHYTSIKKPWVSYSPLRFYFMKYSKFTSFDYSTNLVFKVKILMQFFVYWILSFCFMLKFIMSPILKIYREKQFIKVRMFHLFDFKVYKVSNC
jgi:lipopolysaccharide biosynthesis glycosyltransferase